MIKVSLRATIHSGNPFSILREIATNEDMFMAYRHHFKKKNQTYSLLCRLVMGQIYTISLNDFYRCGSRTMSVTNHYQ